MRQGMRRVALGALGGIVLAASWGACGEPFHEAGTGGGASSTTSDASGSGSTSSGAATGAGGSTGSTGTGSASASSSGAATSSGATSSSGGSGGGPPLSSGDCAQTSDCPQGAKCEPITPGGYRLCRSVPVEATSCGIVPGVDECCSTKDCKPGQRCFPAWSDTCGGPAPQGGNRCQWDICVSDSDCEGKQICVKAGFLGNPVNVCKPAACRHDSDCDASPGGVCAPVEEPCCHTLVGLRCLYPGGGCRRNADCPAGFYCGIEGDSAVCKLGIPQCPL